MQLRLDRDSVCAGDDVEAHDELRRYQPQMKFAAVIQSILNSGFLPIFKGDGIAWVVAIDGKAIGVVSGKWAEQKFSCNPDSELRAICLADPSTIYFQYHSGTDPDRLFLTLLP